MQSLTIANFGSLSLTSVTATSTRLTHSHSGMAASCTCARIRWLAARSLKRKAWDVLLVMG